MCISVKIKQKFSYGNLRDNQENQDYYKVIMPPPFLPNPDFINESNILNSFEKNNQEIYDNFRFKTISKIYYIILQNFYNYFNYENVLYF